MCRAQSRLGYLLNGCVFDIDQSHIVAVVGFVVICIENQSLGANRMCRWCQQVSHFRVVHFLTNFLSRKVRGRVIGCFVGEKVVKGKKETDATALFPLSLIDPIPFISRNLQC
ncbi:MAG: hypothetical protein CL396_07360 [Acidiferrobacteraceae bacterium]|nr:hypothetical protein [Acidiferrobacteraceae bacterium]